MQPRTRTILAAILPALVATIATAAPVGFIKTTIPLNAPPAGLAFDNSGNLLALEGAVFGSNQATLRTILPDGSMGDSFPVVGDDPENFFVGSMTYDPIGERVLIADNTADGRLYAVDALGNQQTLASEIAGVAGVAVRTTGEIFITTSPFDSPGEVLEIDRTTGSTSLVLSGLGYGAGLAFDTDGNLIVQDADSVTFQGRLQRLPMTIGTGGLEFGAAEAILSGMQSSAGVVVDSENNIFTTGGGGLFQIDEQAPAELAFDNNGSPSQFATAIAFDAGAQPFEAFRGPGGGRLAYMADFGFIIQDSFITLLTPAQPGDYNGDGTVNTADYALWNESFGSAEQLAADGNLDGTINAADYVLWRKFAAQDLLPMGSGSSQNVPEPTAYTAMATLLLIMLSRRWRQKSC